MRKMLEVVRALPFSADDVHNTRNAHGTFADTLRDLADRRQAARLKSEKVRNAPRKSTADAWPLLRSVEVCIVPFGYMQLSLEASP